MSGDSVGEGLGSCTSRVNIQTDRTKNITFLQLHWQQVSWINWRHIMMLSLTEVCLQKRSLFHQDDPLIFDLRHTYWGVFFYYVKLSFLASPVAIVFINWHCYLILKCQLRVFSDKGGIQIVCYKFLWVCLQTLLPSAAQCCVSLSALNYGCLTLYWAAPSLFEPLMQGINWDRAY